MPLEGLQKAELVEKGAESLYRRLAAKFREDPKLSGLFVELADEEREHARRLAMLRYQVAEDSRLAERVHIDEALMDRLLDETRAVAQRIVQTSFTPTEALGLAYELERRFSAAHAEVAAAADPWLQEFFASLAEDDGRHRGMIEALSKRRNV